MAITALVEKTVYKFDELSDSAKDHAISQYACDYDWWDLVYEDFNEILTILGFDVEEHHNGRKRLNIEFSGFYHQGSYAAFCGSYHFRKGMVKAIKDYAPQDEELFRIAKELVAMQKATFYSLSANFTYSDYRGYSVDMECSRHNYGWCDLNEPETHFREILKDLSAWLYKKLENEYEYFTSYESFEEQAEANEWTFDSKGNIDYI